MICDGRDFSLPAVWKKCTSLPLTFHSSSTPRFYACYTKSAADYILYCHQPQTFHSCKASRLHGFTMSEFDHTLSSVFHQVFTPIDPSHQRYLPNSQSGFQIQRCPAVAGHRLVAVVCITVYSNKLYRKLRCTNVSRTMSFELSVHATYHHSSIVFALYCRCEGNDVYQKSALRYVVS